MGKCKYEPDSPEEIAARRRKDIVYPRDNELFVDIDSEEALELFNLHVEVLMEKLPGVVVCIGREPSSTEGHYHVTVKLSYPVDPQERILLQAILGSDPTRELLSYIFFKNGREKPTLFFEVRNP